MLALACITLIHGCAINFEKTATEVEKKPQVVTTSSEQPSNTASTSQTNQPPSSVIPPLQVEVLLSGAAIAYREIEKQLNLLLEVPVRTHVLTGVESKDANIISQINKSSRKKIVAVGLRAAKAARKLQGKQVVFCQVFNHGDHNLISETMKGVSALPSLKKLFSEWKQLSPQLDQVLVVTGNGFNDYMAMARTEAGNRNILLEHQVVNTDREFLYHVKRNVNSTEGHWLLADNRVLSVKALKEVMAFNAKNAIQTAVFQPDLLAYGGLFYVSPSPLEISKKVKVRLEESTSGQKIVGEDIVSLDDHEMGINAQVARQLGIKIPSEFKTRIHGQ